MNRIPLTRNDKSKLPTIRKAMFCNMPGVDPLDHNTQNTLLAQVIGYSSFHDLNAEMAKGELPTGRISRLDVRLAVARGLAKVFGLPLPVAYRKASMSKLSLLSIEKVSHEYQDEQMLMEFGVRPHQLAKRDSVEQDLRATGVPDYRFAVDLAGNALNRDVLADLYRAVIKSKDFQVPGGDQVQYLADDLYPNSWAPLSECLADGMDIPNHRVIPVFSEEGLYIGRMIQHVVHEGVIPSLFYTDAELYQGLTRLLKGESLRMGSHIFGMTVDEAISMTLPCTLPIYTLAADASFPRSVLRHDVVHHVPVEKLVRLHGLLGASGNFSLPTYEEGSVDPVGRVQGNFWSVAGERAVASSSYGKHSDFASGYVITKPWLTKTDLPLLYPDFVAPQRPFVEISDEPKLLLPAETEQLIFTAQNHLGHLGDEAESILREGLLTGELLRRMQAEVDWSSAAAKSNEYFDLIYTSQADSGSSSEETSQGWLDTRRAEEQPQYADHVEDLCGAYPVLSHVPAECLRLALVNLFGLPEDVDVRLVEPHEVLAEVLLIAAAESPDQALNMLGKSAMYAAAEWLEHRVLISDVAALAGKFDATRKLVEAQEKRKNEVSVALSEEVRMRKDARAKGFAFLAYPLIRM